MKQICTQIAALCLFVLAQNSYAQSCSTSSTDPNPTPGWGTPLTVGTITGFSSSNATVGAFPKNQTTVLTSPAYHYNGDQATIYFDYNFTKAMAGNTSAVPTITILPTAGSPITCSSSNFNFVDGTADVYFSISPASLFPAATNFRIQISITLTSSDKALVANTLKTNAILTGAGSPLPVKFAGFYAKKNNNGYTSLTWNVATELNVSGYEVQKSIDGSNFSKIGFVSATNSPSYNFVDSKTGDVIYYRIKSIDVDGKYSYSIIVNIKGLQSDVVMKAFPMPVQSELTVQHSAANSDSKLEIISADGRMFKTLLLAKGSQQTTVDLSSAKSGVYVVRFVNGANIQTTKIIKQ